ncbi:MAG: hypothetical protein U9M97_01810 [Candidatus Hadarchaeota archaeon]|nr:hypothetical protein [Candidatus Hadarchaeota archaeon]
MVMSVNSHVCTMDLRVLFTWEISRNAKGRRWFYEKLRKSISEIPGESCEKIGGSVYIVAKKHEHKFEKLLLEFGGLGFIWHKFELKEPG